jgi:hypothetical protein
MLWGAGDWWSAGIWSRATLHSTLEPGKTLNCSWSRKLRRPIRVRRPVLNGDRRETSSLVSLAEIVGPSRLSHERTQKCQHEEHGTAANASEYNWTDHIKVRSMASIT